MIIKGKLLYITAPNAGLLFRKMRFYEVNLADGSTNEIVKVPSSIVEYLQGQLRLSARMFRREPRCTGKLSETQFVVNMSGRLWLLDVKKKQLDELEKTRQGYNLLNFCEVENGLLWGDYGSNPNHEDVKIYSMGKSLCRQIVYSFPKGSIRHIHNIQKSDDGFILMAGDNEPQAGLYRVNKDWMDLKPWKIGKQKYRAVVGFSYKGGLLYATDSVETENHLRLIDAEGDERDLATINGSCIYGCETKDYFIFSTTVESHEGGGLRKILSNELGGGIKTHDVHIIAVSKLDLSIRILKKIRKDAWPMKLFQYGMAVFPMGQENSVDGVWYYNMATKEGDGNSLFLSFNEQDR